MLRNANEAENMAFSLVGTALTEGSNGFGPCNLFFTNVTEDRSWGAPTEELNDVGERRNSRDQDLEVVLGRIDVLWDNNCIRRFAVRGSLSILGGNNVGAICSKATEGSLVSSRTSLIVKAAFWK